MKTSTLSSSKIIIALLVSAAALLMSAAALNGGTALTASAFDGIVTTIKGLLTSSMVLSMALVALFAAVWQITHGKGYGMLSMVLGVLAVAILGPTIMTSVATATRNPISQAQAEKKENAPFSEKTSSIPETTSHTKL
jgi:hypothetical protein